MDIQKQKQLLTWTVILLVILNVGVIGLMIYKNYQQADYNSRTGIERFDDNRRMSRDRACMVHERFGFNEAQREKFEQSADRHRHNMNILKDSIRGLRTGMMQELTREQPDKEKLNIYSEQIGKIHAAIYKETMEHFLDVQEIATPEQREKINDFHMEIARERGFGPYRPGMGDSKHHRHRHGRHHR